MDNPYSKLGVAILRRWPNQLIKGELWDELEQLLTDLLFIEAGCANGLAYTLLGNFDRAQKHVQSQRFMQVRQSIIQCWDAIIDRPELCLQTLYNYLSWIAPLDPGLEKSLNGAKKRLQRKPCWIRAAAPTPEVSGEKMLNIPFHFDTALQSLAADGRTLAIVSSEGEVAFYNLDTGLPIDTEPHHIAPPSALALSNDPEYYLAWIDHQKKEDGPLEGKLTAMSRNGQTTFKCHPKAKLLYHRTGGILTINADDELIAWQPSDTNEPIKLQEKLAQPLLVFRFGPQVKQDSTGQDRANVVYVAGRVNPTIGIATWDGHAWTINSKVLAHSPDIIDADCDSQGKYLALLRKDRSIELIDMQEAATTQDPIRTAYVKDSAYAITGAPVHCAYHPQKDEVFFGTREGNIAAWDWRNKTLTKYRDYCTPTQPRSLVQLSVLPQNDQVFLSFLEAAQTIAPDRPLAERRRHRSAILDCFITAAGDQVISTEEHDSTVWWSTFEGLQLQATRSLGLNPSAITMIAPYHDSRTALVGDNQGGLWRQPPDRAESDAKAVWYLFDGSVLGGFSPEPGIAIAADKTGRILRVQLDQENDQGEVLHHGGEDRQIALRPAGNDGRFWSLRRTDVGTPTSVLSLFDEAGHEQVIFQRTDHVNLTVSADGGTVCLFGRNVYIWRHRRKEWALFQQWSDKFIRCAAFLGGTGHVLAVIPEEGSWLEIRDIDNNWQEIAAVWLPDKATCLSSTGKRMVVGFLSGSLLSWEFMINNASPAHPPQ